jgi:hypothetical protein
LIAVCRVIWLVEHRLHWRPNIARISISATGQE